MVIQTRSPRRAAAAVELAMLLPILALLFAAVLDFARVFQATQVLQKAANDGAMCATGSTWSPTSIPPTAAEIASAHAAGLSLPLPLTPDQLAIVRGGAAKAAATTAGAALNPPLAAEQVAISTAGSAITVTVTYDFPLFCGFLLPNGVQLQRTATARTAPNPFE